MFQFCSFPFPCQVVVFISATDLPSYLLCYLEYTVSFSIIWICFIFIALSLNLLSGTSRANYCSSCCFQQLFLFWGPWPPRVYLTRQDNSDPSSSSPFNDWLDWCLPHRSRVVGRFPVPGVRCTWCLGRPESRFGQNWVGPDWVRKSNVPRTFSAFGLMLLFFTADVMSCNYLMGKPGAIAASLGKLAATCCSLLLHKPTNTCNCIHNQNWLRVLWKQVCISSMWSVWRLFSNFILKHSGLTVVLSWQNRDSMKAFIYLLKRLQ